MLVSAGRIFTSYPNSLYPSGEDAFSQASPTIGKALYGCSRILFTRSTIDNSLGQY